MVHDDTSSPKKGRGGKRAGAGRPKGKLNTLKYGEVRAIRAARLRVPEGTPEAAGDLADRALRRIASVMEGQVHYMEAGNVLKAAVYIREEVCGPVKKTFEHTGPNNEPLTVVVRSLAEDGGKDG